MKNLAFILLLCTCCVLSDCRRGNILLQQQNKIMACGIVSNMDYDSYLNDLIFLQKKEFTPNSKPLLFTIKVHVIGDSAINKQKLEQTIEKLNIAFAPISIRFKVRNKIDYICQNLNVDSLYFDGAIEKSVCNQHDDKRFINLYILEKSGEVLGYTHYPIMNLNRIFISKNKLNEPAMVHEFGHYFGLLHTFENNLIEETDARNCEYAGDKICDTPADPLGASFVEDDCKLWGEYKDNDGNKFSPDMSNYMSYYGKCRSRFTKEQADRMYFIAKNVKLASQ